MRYDAVCKVASTATRDPDLLACSCVAFKYNYTLAPCSGLGGTEQAGSSSADYNNIVCMHCDYFEIIMVDVELNTPAEMRTKYNPAA
jgi:hypothetical protein